MIILTRKKVFDAFQNNNQPSVKSPKKSAKAIKPVDGLSNWEPKICAPIGRHLKTIWRIEHLRSVLKMFLENTPIRCSSDRKLSFFQLNELIKFGKNDVTYFI